jgi:hypothetical protein
VDRLNSGGGVSVEADEEAILSRQLNEAARLRDKSTEDAIKLFESFTDYPRVQVRMREGLEEAARNTPAEAHAFGSNARPSTGPQAAVLHFGW